ncbi:adenosine deaminase 2 [Drosophila pseudoobscura]|uniref:Adenosine deaminase n=1 Tax=Drosophila pseudoobscura pseudoobscura TaxID=46245 RepID=Q2M0I2_DROPS|nr:adenosine deaminase 2 [Drosophila pseudoobscura]
MDTRGLYQNGEHHSHDSPLAARVIRLDVAGELPPNPRLRSTLKYDTVCFNAAISLALFAAFTMLGVAMFFLTPLKDLQATPEELFARKHHSMVAKEQRMQVGGKLNLSPLEEMANARLVKQADMEVQRLRVNYSSNTPQFLKDHKISETDLYGMLKSMPKGGLLHIHDAGMMKLEILIELTYRDDLWVCVGMDHVFENFRFSNVFPHIRPSADDYKCIWMLMSNYHTFEWRDRYEEMLKEGLTLREGGYKNSAELACHMRRSHRLIHGLVTFQPLWSSFLFRMLEDFYSDGVHYVELRSSLPLLYDLNGTNFTILDTVSSIVTITKMFMSTYPDFIGIKIIYTPARDLNDSRMDQYVENARLLKTHFPDLFAGLDLNTFGDECTMPGLGEATQLLHIGDEIDFYFQAGESRCPDMTKPHANLIDAVLLGSKRIGHALNIPQHPELLRTMRHMQVAVELCPLSNHYMQYIQDFREHPAAYLLAAGYPIVMGSDYPHFWDAAPLTDDFYVAFVGIVSGRGNIRLLKQLALNSFLYSSLSCTERTSAINQWSCSWNRWIKEFVNQTNIAPIEDSS